MLLAEEEMKRRAKNKMLKMSSGKRKAFTKASNDGSVYIVLAWQPIKMHTSARSEFVLCLFIVCFWNN